jgi:hypothetical protein
VPHSATHIRDGTVAEEQVEEAAKRQHDKEDSARIAFHLMAANHALTKGVGGDTADDYLKVARSSQCVCACLLRPALRRATGVALTLQLFNWIVDEAFAALLEV